MSALIYRARQAGRGRTLNSDGRFIPAPHTDVVCPPDQDAQCVCGDKLGDHLGNDWSNRTSDVGDRCPSDLSSTFTLLGGDSLDCQHVAECTICGVDVCAEHSSEFTTCAGGEGLHHLDCRFACASCKACARDERGA